MYKLVLVAALALVFNAVLSGAKAKDADDRPPSQAEKSQEGRRGGWTDPQANGSDRGQELQSDQDNKNPGDGVGDAPTNPAPSVPAPPSSPAPANPPPVIDNTPPERHDKPEPRDRG